MCALLVFNVMNYNKYNLWFVRLNFISEQGALAPSNVVWNVIKNIVYSQGSSDQGKEN